MNWGGARATGPELCQLLANGVSPHQWLLSVGDKRRSTKKKDRLVDV